MKIGIPLLAILVLALAMFASNAADTAPGPEPYAIPTFNCIGLYWSPPEGSTDNLCNVRYRESGQTDWREAFPLWFDPRTTEGEGMDSHSATMNLRNRRGRAPEPMPEYARQYRGSIVSLDAGTEYEIELALARTGRREVLRCVTWSETPKIAKVIELPELSDATLEVTKSGTDDGYVVYAPKPGKSAIIDVKSRHELCVAVRASHVIFRGLILKGAARHGIEISEGSKDIIIEDCDISGWGGPDSLEGEKWGEHMHSAIYGMDDDYRNSTISRVVVQRSRIHHPRYDTNSWSEFRKKVDGRDPGRWHPNGPQCITLVNSAGNHVFRYNTCFSDAEHYYNDVFGALSNFSAVGFPNRDSDIYGNWLANCWDDAIESEGANCNVRIWGNFTTQHLVSIAIAGTHVGPLYIWRNISDAARIAPEDVRDDTVGGSFLKAGGHMGFGGGCTYVFHNTLLQRNGGVSTGVASSARPLKNHILRNNILHMAKEDQYSVYESPEASGDNDCDYDLYNGQISSVSGEQEKHGIKGVPVYDPASPENVFALAPESPGYDAGVRLPNFNDDFAGAGPDAGAQEAGRPALEFGVDAYR